MATKSFTSFLPSRLQACPLNYLFAGPISVMSASIFFLPTWTSSFSCVSFTRN